MKKIAITGASSGIGLEIKYKYEKKNFLVTNFSRKSGFNLENENDINKIIDYINKENYKILFLNSGIYSNSFIGSEKDSIIDKILNINLISNIKIINGIWNKILKNQIKVVVTLSTTSYINGVNESIYSVSKKGLKDFIETANTELTIKNSKNKIFKFIPHYIKGTKMSGKTNKPTKELSDIINNLILAIDQDKNEYIPKYESIYKKVFTEHIKNPIEQGIRSYEYRKEKNDR